MKRESNSPKPCAQEMSDPAVASSTHVNKNSNDDESPAPFGEDNASDWHTAHTTQAHFAPVPVLSSQVKARQHISNDCGQFLRVPMPLSAPSGLTTFTYERALRNRIKYHRLCEGGDLDVHKFTPIFVHSMLMLPGTMAHALEKVLSLE